jgi:hypothetical protein
MTENEQKQQLSFAYVHAVAARAGLACDRPTVDDDSVDLVIGASGLVNGRSLIRSPRVELQLKAASQDILHEDHLAFPLPIKNYSELRGETLVPRALVVLHLPADPRDWLEQSEDALIARRCAYWISLQGLPEPRSRQTFTVRLPRTNLFTVENLQAIMDRLSRREPL